VVGRPRSKHPAGKDRLRQEILDAARELFVDEGYSSVSLRKIAQRIGYTPMSIYLHFSDKADILDCICEETFTAFREVSEGLDREFVEPRARLEAGLRAFIDFALAHPHHYQLTFMTPPSAPLALGRRPESGRDAYERFRSRVAACLEPEADVEVAAQVVWSGIHGLISLLIARPDFPWQERQRLVDGVVGAATGWLAGCGERAASEVGAKDG
jgi:AcrR family transcriptional regulator